MKVPLNWLKDYVKVPKDTKSLTHNLTMVGHMLDGMSSYKKGTVIDLELRGNRADCYSIMGIAREVSAIYKTAVKIPPTLTNLKKASQLKGIKLKVDSANGKRVMMAIVRNVKITSSPAWLKDSLTAYGVDSINNIVDLTNYVAIELGEPMHAFDLDKIGSSLYIRQARKNEKMLTFQGKTLTLTPEDLVWANDESVLSVAGAIGGKLHSISDSTKNILVEAASYDQANIRRSVHRLNLITEAGIRHEKNLDPNLVEDAIARFLYLVKKYKWGTVTTNVSDYYKSPVKPWQVSMSWKNLNLISGMDIKPTFAKSILERLNFEISKENKTSITTIVPTYRTDVTEEADIIEEIVRIVGYDKIPAKILDLSVPEDITPDFVKQENLLRKTMEGLAFDEIISLSFVKEDRSDLNQPNNLTESVVTLQNPPSPDFAQMRTSLLPNLLDAAIKAKNERVSSINFFEIGKVYTKKRSKYSEKGKLGLIYFDQERGSYRNFKGYLEALFEKINLDKVSFANSDDHITLKNAYTIHLGKKEVGFGGEHSGMFFAEIDLDSILGEQKTGSVSLWPKYPPQIEDITLQLPPKTKVGDLMSAILSIKFVKEAKLIKVYQDKYTFRIWYQSKSKTLTDSEVKEVREKILSTAGNKFGGVTN